GGFLPKHAALAGYPQAQLGGVRAAVGIVDRGRDAIEAGTAWWEPAPLWVYARCAGASAIVLPSWLVARQKRSARALDASRIHDFDLDGNAHWHARSNFSALVDHDVLNGGLLALLERPMLAAQSDEAVAAAEFRVASIRHVLAPFIAHRALDFELGAQHVGVGQRELCGEFALLVGGGIGLMNGQDIGPALRGARAAPLEGPPPGKRGGRGGGVRRAR